MARRVCIECRQTGPIDRRRATTKHAYDKGWSHLESSGSESLTKKGLTCVGTVCGRMIQHLDLTYHMEQCKERMQAERPILQDKSTLICTRLKISIRTFRTCQLHFVLEMVTAPSARNGSVHLTSFFRKLDLSIASISIRHGPVLRVA